MFMLLILPDYFHYFSKLFLLKGFFLLVLTSGWFYISSTVVLELIALCIDYLDISYNNVITFIEIVFCFCVV